MSELLSNKSISSQKRDKIQSYVQGPKVIESERLEAFEYEYSGKPIKLDISTEEFTCLCPWLGLPDFAKLTIIITLPLGDINKSSQFLFK